jgi:hypothetical protein
VRTSESEVVERPKAEVRRLERECGRWLALLRAAQRTVGIAAPKPAKAEPDRKRHNHPRPAPGSRGPRASHQFPKKTPSIREF